MAHKAAKFYICKCLWESTKIIVRMATEAGSSTVAKRRASALIVDDSSIVRMITTKHLSTMEFEVSSVKDGVEVVAMYEAGKGHFDVIVMDLEMPVVNGIQATAELRAMGVDCKIIGATACNDASLKQSFLEAGLDHLFEKPLDVAKLKSCLQ
ncbi:two-component response regulator 24-like [Apium graveolens]|uniref:two-component response regulator 24-like n=2 Tax=Apium graveolens TaxID=4045 RepID=UPI003D794D0C